MRFGKAPSLLLFALCAALLFFASAQRVAVAETPEEGVSSTTGKLEVLSPKDKLEVELVPAQESGLLEGSVSLLLRNGADTPADLDVQYLPAGEATAKGLPGGSEMVFLEGEGLPGEGPIELAAETARALALRFEVDADESADAIDGQLILTLSREEPVATGSEATVVKRDTALLPVSGVAVKSKGISIQPESLTFDSDGSAQVRLVGQGLAEFLEAAEASAGGLARTAVISDEAGNQAKLKVLLPKAEKISPQTPHEATATVELASDEDPPPGAYSGKIALEDTPEAPTIAVTVNSQTSFWCMVLIVLIGVVAGGLITRLVSLAARRTLLLENLGRSLGASWYVRNWQAAGKMIPTESWRLEDLLDEPELDDEEPEDSTPETVRAERLQGIPGLVTSIKTARSAKDLDEDTVRVLDVIARLQRWLRLEPAARRLAKTAEEDAPQGAFPVAAAAEDEEPIRWGWADTKTWRATEVIRKAARREPKDVDAADALVAELLWQAEWHHHFAAAWTAVKKAFDKKKDKDGALRKALKAVDDSVKAISRTPEERDALDAQLAACIQGPLRDLKIDPGDLPEPENPTAAHGVTPVKWSASPNLFTGWATLDGKSYGQLARRATSTARANTTHWGWGTGSWATFGRELRVLRPADFAWTFVALFIASVAYAQANYGDTWGTTEDIGTAIMAGLLGSATVNWAALPIFRSIRLRQGENEFTELLGKPSDDGGGGGEEPEPKPAAEEKPADPPAPTVVLTVPAVPATSGQTGNEPKTDSSPGSS